jgi:hypothetical protein
MRTFPSLPTPSLLTQFIWIIQQAKCSRAPSHTITKAMDFQYDMVF